MTVCVYRQGSVTTNQGEYGDMIYTETKEFPQAPRDDLITRHIYQFIKYNK